MKITEIICENSNVARAAKLDNGMSEQQATEAIYQLDPTASKQFVMWLLVRYGKQEFKLSNAREVSKLLQDYASLVKTLPKQYHDIKKFSYPQLKTIVSRYTTDLFPDEFADKTTTHDVTHVVSSKGDTEVTKLSNTNDLGKLIAHTKQALENFWNWFGDSVTVDSKGRPIVMHHSTRADFSKFEVMRPTTNAGMFGMPFETKRAAIFMTPNKDFAESYSDVQQGANTMQLYVKMENPFDLRQGLSSDMWDELEEAGFNPKVIYNLQYYWEAFEEEYGGEHLVQTLKQLGYDGAIIHEDDSEGESQITYVAFDPSQIKSAIGNKGSFSKDSDSVTETKNPR